MQRLSRNEAMKLVQRCLKEGQVSFSGHARNELDADDMTTQDAINVLRGGRIETEAEWERGSWRYRVSTPRYVVVVEHGGRDRLAEVGAPTQGKDEWQ